MVDAAEAIGKARAAVIRARGTPGHEPDGASGRAAQAHRPLRHLSGRWASSSAGSSTTGVDFLQAPLNRIGKSLVFTHPMDALNLDLQVALLGGAILASPFILYQVWLFIAPGLYQKERRFVVPFMAATVGLFLAGAAFGYFYVLPGALKILIVDFGHNFTPMVTIEDYTSFFLSIILGLGISFEMPILIFFLAMFGIVSPQVPLEEHSLRDPGGVPGGGHHLPSPDPWTMCIYAIPMLALYLIGIGSPGGCIPRAARPKRPQHDRLVAT